MKKTLLLSVVASTMIMAGGDIAPVEPAVVVPAPVAAPVVVATPVVAPVAAPVATCGSGWKYEGQAVVYYQTADEAGAGAGDPVSSRSLFDQKSSSADAGLSLKAYNSNVIGGIGAGAKVVVLDTLNLEQGVVSNVMQNVDGKLNGAALTEAYLTYGIGNTSLKVGRQTLPQSLSPMAYSENWNVFQNTYEAALLVNTDLPQTTLVGAFVLGNNTISNLGDFNNVNKTDGVYMMTAQNKSIDGLTLTGTTYLANSYLTKDALNISWLDADFGVAGYNAALQGGYIAHNAIHNDTTAIGGKIGGKFGDFSASLAGSHTDGNLGVFNVGGTTNSLYTTLEENAGATGLESSTVALRLGMDIAGGTLGLASAYSQYHNNGVNNFMAVAGLPGPIVTRPNFGNANSDAFIETDLTYATKVGCVDLLGAYIWQTDDNSLDGNKNNIIRAVARYNF